MIINIVKAQWVLTFEDYYITFSSLLEQKPTSIKKTWNSPYNYMYYSITQKKNLNKLKKK